MKTKIFHLASITLCAFVCMNFAIAQPGSLDSSFGTNGILSLPDRTGILAVQPDGKFILAGTRDNTLAYSYFKFYTQRFNNDWTVDNSFNGTGTVITQVGSDRDYAGAVKVLSNGKILVAGSSSFGSNGWKITLLQYNPNGTLDNSFGVNGISTTSISPATQISIACMNIQKDGKILLGGYAYFASTFETKAELIKFNSNGTIDSSFDGDGILYPTINSPQFFYSINGILEQPDEKIVISGLGFDVAIGNICVLQRLTKTGSPDISFNSIGYNTFNTAPDDLNTSTLIQQPDGKFLICATIYQDFTHQKAGVIRFNNNGTVDNNFGTNGITITTVSGDSLSFCTGRHMILQADGKILISGRAFKTDNITNPNFYSLLVRYKSNGEPDETFGKSGNGIVPGTVLGNIGGQYIIEYGNRIYELISHVSIDTSYPSTYVQAYKNDQILPVTLVNFTANFKNGNVLVSWQTENELNTSHFTIQRSTDGANFTNIGRVSAAGNSSTLHNYHYEDIGVSKLLNATTIYYRLETMDNDGKSSLSKIVQVNINTDNVHLVVYPNPAKDKAVVAFNTTNAAKYTLKITDVSGKLLKKITGESIAGDNSITIDVSRYPRGMYLVVLTNDEHGRKAVKLYKE